MHHPCPWHITPASGASFWLQAHYPCLIHIIPWLTWITLTTGTSSQPQVNYRCLRRISLASGELPLPQTHHSGLRRITPTSVARNLTCCCCCCWCRQCWCFWNRQCCCYPFIGVVKLEKPLKISRDRQTDERTGRQMDRPPTGKGTDRWIDNLYRAVIASEKAVMLLQLHDVCPMVLVCTWLCALRSIWK